MDENESLRRRAEAGEAFALYTLGVRTLLGQGLTPNPAKGAQMVAAAASKGLPEARSFLSVIFALSQNWPKAFATLADSAATGDPNARAQFDLLGGPGFDPVAWIQPSVPAWRWESPRIAVIDDFLPKEMCSYVIERARPKLQAVRINDPSGGGARPDGYRSNSGMGFRVTDTDFVLQLIQARIASRVGLPVLHQEPTNVLHYQVGEEYRPHFDFIDPKVASFGRELSSVGQRVATFLVYLNDDYEGGETHFPRLDWGFKGKTGDALLFWNVGPDGEVERRSLHAGLAPTSGEKWLLSKWIRDRPIPLV